MQNDIQRVFLWATNKAVVNNLSHSSLCSWMSISVGEIPRSKIMAPRQSGI